ncbi:MAG TPA: hypothetical protein VGG71_06140 [Chitinophagaceae bacterium]
MKLFLLTIVCCFIVFSGFSQNKGDQDQFPEIYIDLGPDYTFANAQNLNQWIINSGQKLPQYSVSGHLALSFLFRHFGGGLKIFIPNPYRMETFFFGTRLTCFNSRFSSWLNLEIGEFDALYNHLRPVNYTLTPDQQGKSMQLKYDNLYFGVSNKTYWKHRSKKDLSTEVGIDLMAGYMPWQGSWKYGYYIPSGKTLRFVGNSVYGIPPIDSLFVNVGLFCGLGGSVGSR